jgi:hypothetical protein
MLVDKGHAVEIDATALTMLLDGIDLRRVRRPSPWQPKRSPVDKRDASCFNGKGGSSSS